jgi:hypothetical protein
MVIAVPIGIKVLFSWIATRRPHAEMELAFAAALPSIRAASSHCVNATSTGSDAPFTVCWPATVIQSTLTVNTSTAAAIFFMPFLIAAKQFRSAPPKKCSAPGAAERDIIGRNPARVVSVRAHRGRGRRD